MDSYRRPYSGPSQEYHPELKKLSWNELNYINYDGFRNEEDFHIYLMIAHRIQIVAIIFQIIV